MEPILVKFEADAGGLQPGIDGLVQLEVIDKQVAEQAKKTAQVIRDRDKDISAGAKASKAGIDQLTQSFNTLYKAVIGGAMKQTLTEIRDSLRLTDDEAKKFFQTIKQNAQQDLLKGGTPEQIEQLNQLLNMSNEMLDKLGAGAEETGAKTQSFRARLRELKAELQAMEDAGLEGTAAFEKLQIEAGRVSDQIQDTNQRIAALSSDTFVFDALASGVQGVAGAFAIAQGAASLFGDENKDLQQALLKVQQAMALVQGVQSVINVLQKQSAASIGIDILLRKFQKNATDDQTVSTVAQTAATEGATIAQTALNAAMLANPAVILLVTLAAITTALMAFTRGADDAADSQDRLNKTLQENEEISNRYLHNLDNANKEIIASLKERGAADDEIAKQEFDHLRNKLDAVNKEIDATDVLLAKELGNGKKNIEYYDNLQKRRLSLATEATDIETDLRDKAADHHRKVYLDDIKNYTAYQDAKVFQARKGSIEELEALINAEKAKRDATIKSDPNLQPGEIIKIKAETNRKIQEYDNQIVNLQLQNKKYLIDSSLAEAERGSVEELLIKKKSLDAQLQIELNELGISDEKKTFLRAQAAQSQRDLDDQIAIKQIEQADYVTSAKLARAKEGSKEEFYLKLNQLENLKNIELVKAGENAELRGKVEAEFQRKRLDLTKEYNRKIAEDTINGRIAELNSEISKLQIANASQTNNQLLKAKQKLIDEQAELEVIGVQNSVMNEEDKRKKIQAIYDKALADKIQLERDKVNAEIKFNLEMQNGELNIRLASLNRLAESQKNNIAGSLYAQLKAFDVRKEIIDNEKKANEDAHAQGTISEQEYQKKILDLKEKYAQLGVERVNAIIESGAQVTMMIGNALFNGQKQRLDEEAKANDDLKNKKILSEEGYQKRQREINIRKAKADKDQALFNIAINTATAVAKAIAESPITFGLPFSAFAIAQGAIQAALVLSRPLPKYKDGKIGIQGPGTETSDDILARLSVNESVINAAMTKKWRPALEAINSNRFEDYLGKLEMPKIPYSIGVFDVPEKIANQSTAVEIDYDKVGASVAKYVGRVSDISNAEINIDENGIRMIVKKGNDRTEFINHRYSSN